MYFIEEHLLFEQSEFKEKFTHNLVEFFQTIEHNLHASQTDEYKKSKEYIVGPIQNISVEHDLHYLEMSLGFIYGNHFLEEIAYQYVNDDNFYTNINKNFLANSYTANILSSYEDFYLKQSAYVKKIIRSFFIGQLNIDLSHINYVHVLKEFFPIYEKQQFDTKINVLTHDSKKIKL